MGAPSSWPHPNASEQSAQVSQELGSALLYNLPLFFSAIVIFYAIHRVPACSRLRLGANHGSCTYYACMPCRGRKNRVWWNRAYTCWAWCLLGMLAFILCERGHELAVNEERSSSLSDWQEAAEALEVLVSSGQVSAEHAELLLSGPPPAPTNNWNSQGAWFFATQIISTIGYGNFTPATYGGRGLTCLYSLVGIALFTTFLFSSGSRIIASYRVVVHDNFPCCHSKVNQRQRLKQSLDDCRDAEVVEKEGKAAGGGGEGVDGEGGSHGIGEGEEEDRGGGGGGENGAGGGANGSEESSPPPRAAAAAAGAAGWDSAALVAKFNKFDVDGLQSFTLPQLQDVILNKMNIDVPAEVIRDLFEQNVTVVHQRRLKRSATLVRSRRSRAVVRPAPPPSTHQGPTTPPNLMATGKLPSLSSVSPADVNDDADEKLMEKLVSDDADTLRRASVNEDSIETQKPLSSLLRPHSPIDADMLLLQPRLDFQETANALAKLIEMSEAEEKISEAIHTLSIGLMLWVALALAGAGLFHWIRYVVLFLTLPSGLTSAHDQLTLTMYLFYHWISDATGESWFYTDSLYFVIVSVTTVGFGDFAPTLPQHAAGLSSNTRLVRTTTTSAGSTGTAAAGNNSATLEAEQRRYSAQNAQMNLYFTYILVLCGGLTSVLINTMQELLEAGTLIKAAKRKNGAAVASAARQLSGDGRRKTLLGEGLLMLTGIQDNDDGEDEDEDKVAVEVRQRKMMRRKTFQKAGLSLKGVRTLATLGRGVALQSGGARAAGEGRGGKGGGGEGGGGGGGVKRSGQVVPTMSNDDERGAAAPSAADLNLSDEPAAAGSTGSGEPSVARRNMLPPLSNTSTPPPGS